MDGLTFDIPPSRAAGMSPRRAEPYTRLAVIGMGSWGTALAAVAASAGCETRLWGRRETLANELLTAGVFRRDRWARDQLARELKCVVAHGQSAPASAAS